jgi:hypothetical protein
LAFSWLGASSSDLSGSLAAGWLSGGTWQAVSIKPMMTKPNNIRRFSFMFFLEKFIDQTI